MTVASATLPSRPAALRPVTLVVLPFAAGYYLSYLFRTINALIASRLAPISASEPPNSER